MSLLGTLLVGKGKMLEDKVKKYIKENHLIESGETIVAGVSGGPDSICMLTILEKLREELHFKIVVAHINHGIRESALADEEYVKKICEQKEIPIYIKKENIKDIAQKEKIGIEEAGRMIRYSFFEEIMKKINGQKIATAHNLNDQAETILMNLFRGSGINGLKGIEKNRNGKYIRPLINCSRKEIEEYCEKNNLKPRIDETNQENIYTRNKIRNICIPYIEKEFNPNIIKTLARLSDIVTEETNYMDAVIEKEYENLMIKEEKKEIILDLKKFNLLELVIKRRILLYTINRLMSSTLGIEKINIDDLIKLCQNNIGNKYLIPTKKLKVLVKNKKIFFQLM